MLNENLCLENNNYEERGESPDTPMAQHLTQK